MIAFTRLLCLLLGSGAAWGDQNWTIYQSSTDPSQLAYSPPGCWEVNYPVILSDASKVYVARYDASMAEFCADQTSSLTLGVDGKQRSYLEG